MGYDQWLEKPYQDEYAANERYEDAERAYLESDYYSENIGEWEESGKSLEDYKNSQDYKDSVLSYMELMVLVESYNYER